MKKPSRPPTSLPKRSRVVLRRRPLPPDHPIFHRISIGPVLRFGPSTAPKPAEERVLYYTVDTGNIGVVFADPDKARHVSAIHKAIDEARTWGEFATLLPDGEWNSIVGRWESVDHDIPDPAAEFDSSEIPGYCDGDYPDWLQKEMLRLLPRDLCEKFGKIETSVFNGQFLFIPPENLDGLIKALVERGIRAEHTPDLWFH